MWLVPQFGAHPVEQFGVVLLDTQLPAAGHPHHLQPARSTTVRRHPREVFREAVAARAAFVVVFHNHPSGDAMPSRDDQALTLQLADAADLLGIGLLDHLDRDRDRLLLVQGALARRRTVGSAAAAGRGPGALSVVGGRWATIAVWSHADSLLRLLQRRLRRHDSRRAARRRRAAGRAQQALGSLAVDGYDVSAERVLRAGVSATKFRVHRGRAGRDASGSSSRSRASRPRPSAITGTTRLTTSTRIPIATMTRRRSSITIRTAACRRSTRSSTARR